MAKGIAALGTKLLKGSTPIAELTNISGPRLTVDQLEVTSHDSEGGYREYVPTLRTGGEVAIEGNFVPTDEGQFALYEAFNDGTSDTYTIQLPQDLGSWTFDANVSAFEMGAPFEGKLTFSATLRITGPSELTVGVS